MKMRMLKVLRLLDTAVNALTNKESLLKLVKILNRSKIQ